MTKKQINQQIDDLKGLKSLVETYEEVAALRMQAIRQSVLVARDFLDGLSAVFAQVKSNIDKNVDVTSISTLNRNGKSVAVFISANEGLYGDIINKTYELFIQFVGKREADAVVIGKLGVKIVSERNPTLLYNYFDFSDKGKDMDNLGLVMRYLLQFERIYVFHGRYQSLLNQEPVVSSISGDQIAVAGDASEHHLYLFEPNIMDVLRMFEGEIMATMFSQTMHESQLAKFASRLFHLDQAVGSIDQTLGEANVGKRRVIHALAARKQLNTISGISLWS